MPTSRLRGLIGVLCAAWTVAAGCESRKSPVAHGPGALPMPRVDVNPQLRASTFLAHAGLLERQGNYPAAAEQYARALELSPNLVTAHNRRGIVLNRLGRHAEASAHFRRALALQPRDPQLHNNLGFSLLLEGDLTAAEQELARALELDPTFRRARMNRGLVLGKLGRDDEALAEFRLAGSEEDALYNLAVVQADRGRYADAARSLEQALRRNPDFADAREQLRQIARLAAAREAAEPAVPELPGATTASDDAPRTAAAPNRLPPFPAGDLTVFPDRLAESADSTTETLRTTSQIDDRPHLSGADNVIETPRTASGMNVGASGTPGAASARTGPATAATRGTSEPPGVANRANPAAQRDCAADSHPPPPSVASTATRPPPASRRGSSDAQRTPPTASDIQPAASIEALPAPRSVIERCTPQTLTDADRRELADEIRRRARALYGPFGAGPRRPDAISHWLGATADADWFFGHHLPGRDWFRPHDPQP